MTVVAPTLPAHLETLRIDVDRLVSRLDALAEIGPLPGGGSSRLALTDEDRAGRELVVTWMRDLDLDVGVDAIGNVFGVRPGRFQGPPVLTGSHIDTVASGGRFDGNLGVLAGLEIIELLAERDVVTDRAVGVAFFTNEEGARFSPDMMGSLVHVGGMPLEEALDTIGIDGATVGGELDRIGYRGTLPCPGPSPHAFVELHIEQGPVLEEAGVTLGAVDGVQGISWQQLTVHGQANHAGTTPIRLRRDAGLVVAETTAFVRRLAVELGGDQVGTVGRIDLEPNLVNVVAHTARCTIDLRNTDEATLQEARRRVQAFVEGCAADQGCTVEWRSLARFEPVAFDPAIVAVVEQEATALGHTVRRLASGAGHDAQMLARTCPTAMVFTPSRAGISHNPAEFTETADLQAGADVLLRCLLRLATMAEGDGPWPAT
jgi:N-carbamoyl-L-amino-acid hydrolase